MLVLHQGFLALQLDTFTSQAESLRLNLSSERLNCRLNTYVSGNEGF